VLRPASGEPDATLAAHAAVQEAHDGASIHLRCRESHMRMFCPAYANSISACSRLLASLHTVMPSIPCAENAQSKHHQTLAAHVRRRVAHFLNFVFIKVAKSLLCVLVCSLWDRIHNLFLQMQKAHDCIGELELSHSASVATRAELSKVVKSKKRSPQVLFRTDNGYDCLGSSDKAETEASSSAQPQTGSAAVVDFSDVSLDWGLGKLV
jgi:hypothetical protein